MQSKWNRIQSGTARGTWVALLSVLIILLFAATANAASAPIIVSQTTQYAALPAGGPFAGEDPVGSSWGIDSQGVVVVSSTYGNNIYQYAPPAYTPTVAGPFSNASGVAIDNNGYLFVSGQYSNVIAKFPMNPDGTYTWTVDPTATAPPTCAGDGKTPDTAGACLITSLTTSSIGLNGVVSMAFDSSNNLYFATDDQGSNPFSIYQCKTPCAYPASGATAVDPTLLYAEPIQPSGAVATQGQLRIGAMAFDPWGDLFFTDAAVWPSAPTSGGTGPGAYLSNLNELPVVTKTINATKFAAAPLVILTETNTTPISGYNDAIVGVSISSNGNVYISLVNSGIYGLTSNGSLNSLNTGVATVSASSLWGISNQGTKLLATDNNGDSYAFTNSGHLDYIYTGPVRFPGPVVVGTPETVNVVVADNSELCATAALTFTSSVPAFTAAPTTGTSCANMSLGPGSLTPETLTYTPAAAGFVPATITVADTASSASTATPVASAGQVVTISQTTFGHKLLNGGAWGGTSPGGTSSALTSSTSPVPGIFIVGSSYGNDIEEFSPLAGNLTATAVSDGPLSGGGGVAIDSNGYLFMSNEYGNSIYKAPPNAAGSASAYGPWATDPSASGNTTPACTGDGKTPDTAGICVIATNYQGSSLTAGTAALGFDKNNNLFIATSNNNAPTNTYSVFECGPTCLYSGADAVLLFAEPVAAATTPQLQVGDIVVDPNLNVFFTDTDITPLASEMSLYSDLYELPYDSATSSYDKPAVLLETLTPVCAALAGCTYNNAINTVATDANGDVFFGTPYGGIYKIANNSGTLDSQFPLAIASQATKIIVPDGTTGNFYFVNYNGGGDTAGYIQVGSVTVAPTASVGTPSSVTNVSAVDNNAGCFTGQADLTFTAVNTDFTAVETPGNGCGTLPFGTAATFPVTVTYTPTGSASGPATTTVTATSAATSDTGTASVTGTAAVITAQTITFTNPTASETVDFGVAPIVLAATATSTLPVTFSIDAASTAGAATLAADGVTLTINTPGAVIIDAAQAGGASGGLTYGPATASITITVDQATQTIVFNPTSPVTFGIAPITLSATGGASGNPVVIAIASESPTGIATLAADGVTLTITGAGTINLTADQTGNANYAAATEVLASIVVTQAAQTITFTSPAASETVIVGVNPIVLAATATSTLPVTFAIDASSTAGAASLAADGVTLTINAPGTVIIDAAQAGNANYAAATAASVTITVNAAGVVATPAITPAAGTLTIGSNNTVTITDATAGAAIAYTTDGSDPLTSATATVYTAPFTLPTAGTITVTAAAVLANYTPSAEASVIYTVQTLAQNFTISASPTTATVTSSTPAVITITVAPDATFTGAISFACTGTGVTCTFSPATVTAPATTTTLTISKSTTAALHNGPNPFLPAGVSFAIALGFLGWKKRRGMFLALVVLASVICLTQLTACGGSSAKTSTVTVTATGGTPAVTQTVALTITVK